MFHVLFVFVATCRTNPHEPVTLSSLSNASKASGLFHPTHVRISYPWHGVAQIDYRLPYIDAALE